MLLLMTPGVVFLVSCGSSKMAKDRDRAADKTGVTVSKDDNLKLYQFVGGWLGTPHRDGGCDKQGIDCSCFVGLAYQEVYGKQLPRSSSEMHNRAERIDTTSLREGDLLFFAIKSVKVSHVGIYLKDGRFAHVSTSKGVMISSLAEQYYRKYFKAAGRFAL